MKKLNIRLSLSLAFTLIAMTVWSHAGFVASARAGTSAGKVQKETKEAYEATKAYTLEKKDEYVQKVENELKKLDKAYDRVSSKAKSKAGDLKQKSKAEIEAMDKDLEQKRKAAAEKLHALKSSSQDAWEKLKSGMDSAVDDLSSAIDQAKAKFKEK